MYSLQRFDFAIVVIDSDPKFSLMPPFIRYLSEVAFIQIGDASITGVPG